MSHLRVLLLRHHKTGNVQPASYEGRVIIGTEGELLHIFGEKRCSEFGFAEPPDRPTIPIREWLLANNRPELVAKMLPDSALGCPIPDGATAS